jgi:hypothetical protein
MRRRGEPFSQESEALERGTSNAAQGAKGRYAAVYGAIRTSASSGFI